MNWGCYLKLGLLRPSPCAQSPGHEIELLLPLSPKAFADSMLSLKPLPRLIASRFGCRGRSGCHRGRLREGLEAPTAAPHAVQDDRQFAGHRDDGALFAPLGSAAGQLQSPAAQLGVGTETTEDVLRRLHQKTAQTAIAGFRDATLRVRVAGLALSGTQAEEGARGAVAGRIGPVQGEHVGGGNDRTYAWHSAQQADLRIL